MAGSWRHILESATANPAIDRGGARPAQPQHRAPVPAHQQRPPEQYHSAVQARSLLEHELAAFSGRLAEDGPAPAPGPAPARPMDVRPPAPPGVPAGYRPPPSSGQPAGYKTPRLAMVSSPSLDIGQRLLRFSHQGTGCRVRAGNQPPRKKGLPFRKKRFRTSR